MGTYFSCTHNLPVSRNSLEFVRIETTVALLQNSLNLGGAVGQNSGRPPNITCSTRPLCFFALCEIFGNQPYKMLLSSRILTEW